MMIYDDDECIMLGGINKIINEIRLIIFYYDGYQNY